MKPLQISEAEKVIAVLQDEIRRSHDARYDHRLHAVLLVAQGMTCPEVSRLLGDALRTVENWVRRFEEDGPAGLVEGERPGRPRRLNEEQLDEIRTALGRSPGDYGLSAKWDGKTLSDWIQQRWGISLGVRQCQRLFRRFGFDPRKPRPLLTDANPEEQTRSRKTLGAHSRSGRGPVGDG